MAPLLVNKLIEPSNIVIDAKTGISGAGRGSANSTFGYAESNENLVPYGLLKHVHMPEIARAAGQAMQNANLICCLSETVGLDGVPVWP